MKKKTFHVGNRRRIFLFRFTKKLFPGQIKSSKSSSKFVPMGREIVPWRLLLIVIRFICMYDVKGAHKNVSLLSNSAHFFEIDQ